MVRARLEVRKQGAGAGGFTLIESRLDIGEVAEWPNVPDSKSGVPQGTVGSNPTLSAKD